MYVSAVAIGTQTSVITTEHTLNSPAVAGRFKLIVDTSVMVAGDVLELRAKQIALTGGTLRVVYFAAFYGVQPTDGMIKVLEIVDNELVEAGAVSFTLKQTFGTVHAYPWKVLNLATTPANISALSIDASGRLDISKLLGTAISTPATAGILDVNVKNINNVAASSVTTVSANIGTTQPVNFTGTGASALAKSDMVDVAGAAVSTSSAQIGVNVVNLGGTAQTGRDIGASVLLSNGTGTGQLDFTSGVVKANLAQILGTALTETAGQIAAAFKKFFDKATPTGTINSIPDAVAGATGGLFIAGTNAATTVTTSLTTTFTGNLTGNVGGNVTGSVGSVASGGITAASFAANALDAVWSVTTRLLTAGTNIVLAKGTGVTGFTDLSAAQVNAEADTALADVGVTTTITGRIDAAISSRLASAGYTAPLDAAGVRTAVGLASANLDTQLSTIDDFLDTEIAAIKLKTDLIPPSPAAVGDIPTANANADALLDRANGVEASLTVRGALRLALATLAGKASGMETTTAVFRNAVADSKDRITATVDADGNRSAVTTDVS